MQDSAGTHSSGHVMFDEKMICGENWDLAASQVVYIGFLGNNKGSPKFIVYQNRPAMSFI